MGAFIERSPVRFYDENVAAPTRGSKPELHFLASHATQIETPEMERAVIVWLHNEIVFMQAKLKKRPETANNLAWRGRVKLAIAVKRGELARVARRLWQFDRSPEACEFRQLTRAQAKAARAKIGQSGAEEET